MFCVRHLTSVSVLASSMTSLPSGLTRYTLHSTSRGLPEASAVTYTVSVRSTETPSALSAAVVRSGESRRTVAMIRQVIVPTARFI